MSRNRSDVVPVVEKVIRIQRGIAVLFVERAVKFVRPGLLVRADKSPCTTAILGAHAVGKDGKIFHGLEWRIDIDSARAKVVVVLRAVEHVRSAGLPGSAGSRSHVQPRAHRGRHKGEDVKNVTVDQRCVLDGLGIHLVREIGGRCLHQRNFGGHFHELRGFGQFQLAVNGNGLARLKDDS